MTGCSTNSMLHLPAIAHSFGISMDAKIFDEMNRDAHYLLNVRPTGFWPAQYVYYAGGVPAIMEEIRSMLTEEQYRVTQENATERPFSGSDPAWAGVPSKKTSILVVAR